MLCIGVYWCRCFNDWLFCLRMIMDFLGNLIFFGIWYYNVRIFNFGSERYYVWLCNCILLVLWRVFRFMNCV